MKITINGEKKELKAVWNENNLVHMIDQRLIPHKVEIYTSNNYLETGKAIKDMIIRGAPTIGATAAYGLSQAVYEYENNNLEDSFVDNAYNYLLATRPTAVDLIKGLNYVMKSIRKEKSFSKAINSANEFSDYLVDEAKMVSTHGEKLIEENMKILTHCNTGPLATVDIGTALGVIIKAHRNQKSPTVFVDETRPRLQGARLTTFELQQEGIKFYLNTDNTAGYLMKKGMIDMVILGADRVTKNGDIANKIGTYSLAVLAKHNNIPFYSAFPSSTYDKNLIDGSSIVVEERDSTEVVEIRGQQANGVIGNTLISPKNIESINYAFDITENSLLSGYITPKGVLQNNELEILGD